MNRPDAAFAWPRRPLDLDPEPDPTSMVLLDGTIKQCLEIGRTRLLYRLQHHRDPLLTSQNGIFVSSPSESPFESVNPSK